MWRERAESAEQRVLSLEQQHDGAADDDGWHEVPGSGGGEQMTEELDGEALEQDIREMLDSDQEDHDDEDSGCTTRWREDDCIHGYLDEHGRVVRD